MVSCIGVACSLLIFLFIILFVLHVFYCIDELFVECVCYLSVCDSCLVECYDVDSCLGSPFIASFMYSVCIFYLWSNYFK